MYIECKYSCFLCGLSRVVFKVRARTVEDITTWMEDVLTPALVADHSLRSPNCHPDTMSELLVPITGSSKIGGPVEN